MMVYFKLMIVKWSLMMMNCLWMMVKCLSMMVKWVYDHILISPSFTGIWPSLTSSSPSLAWSVPSFAHLTIIEKLHRLQGCPRSCAWVTRTVWPTPTWRITTPSATWAQSPTCCVFSRCSTAMGSPWPSTASRGSAASQPCQRDEYWKKKHICWNFIQGQYFWIT